MVGTVVSAHSTKQCDMGFVDLEIEETTLCHGYPHYLDNHCGLGGDHH